MSHTQPLVTPAAAVTVPQMAKRAALQRLRPDWPGLRTRWIMEPGEAGWSGFALAEWELEAAGWADHHPHDEVNIVVEGELHVETGGVTVVASPGDAVHMPAGCTGRYWAPRYARMIGVYGPNPAGAGSDYVQYWDIGPARPPARPGDGSIGS